MRRSALVLGISLALATVLSAPMLACSCGPGPDRPSMATCSDPTMPTVSRVTLLHGTGVELVDGSSVPVRFGAQGGSHVEFRAELEGTGFGSCIAERAELLTVDGVSLALSDGTVRLEMTGASTARTYAILLFPSGDVPSSAILRVEIAGQMLERRLGTVADAGVDSGTDSGI